MIRFLVFILEMKITVIQAQLTSSSDADQKSWSLFSSGYCDDSKHYFWRNSNGSETQVL